MNARFSFLKPKSSIGKYALLGSMALVSVLVPGITKAQGVTNERQLPIMDF